MKLLFLFLTLFILELGPAFAQAIPDIHPNKRIDNPGMVDNKHRRIEHTHSSRQNKHGHKNGNHTNRARHAHRMLRHRK
jgi:hypothetical protein